jgi:hypothetical protein
MHRDTRTRPFLKLSTYHVLPKISSKELPKNETKPEPKPTNHRLPYVAVWNFEPLGETELSLTAGDTVYSIEDGPNDPDWIFVSKSNGEEGYVPRNILEIPVQKTPTTPSLLHTSTTSPSLTQSNLKTQKEEPPPSYVDDHTIIYGEVDPVHQRPTVKAASQQKLVELLVSDYCYPDFRFCFLISFHCFLTPVELISILKTIFKEKISSNSDNIKSYAHLIGLLKLWIESHGTDFAATSPARTSLEELFTMIAEISVRGVEQLRKLLEKMDRRDSQMETGQDSSSTTFPPLDKVHTWSGQHIKSFAEQITQLKSKKFREINISEFFQFVTKGLDALPETNSIPSFVRLCNTLYEWALWEVCRRSKSESLNAILEVFGNLTVFFYELRNYASTKEV